MNGLVAEGQRGAVPNAPLRERVALFAYLAWTGQSTPQNACVCELLLSGKTMLGSIGRLGDSIAFLRTRVRTAAPLPRRLVATLCQIPDAGKCTCTRPQNETRPHYRPHYPPLPDPGWPLMRRAASETGPWRAPRRRSPAGTRSPVFPGLRVAPASAPPVQNFRCVFGGLVFHFPELQIQYL
jgi:hypothetical protein